MLQLCVGEKILLTEQQVCICLCTFVFVFVCVFVLQFCGSTERGNHGAGKITRRTAGVYLCVFLCVFVYVFVCVLVCVFALQFCVEQNSRCVIAENVPKFDSTSFLVSFVFSSNILFKECCKNNTNENTLLLLINYIDISIGIHPLNC